MVTPASPTQYMVALFVHAALEIAGVALGPESLAGSLLQRLVAWCGASSPVNPSRVHAGGALHRGRKHNNMSAAMTYLILNYSNILLLLYPGLLYYDYSDSALRL